MPFKFFFIKRLIGKKKEFSLLDVGAGNHSSSLTKHYFPKCKYYGIDKSKNYNNNEDDFKCMERFYEKDLTALDFSDITDDFFDVIMMSHIIEHLYNGEEVITEILKKLRKNGIIFIEYPSFRSTRLPSKRDTLNFFDDPTHIRLYSLMDIYNVLLKENCEILKGGTRRDFKMILLLPLLIPYLKIKYGYVGGGAFWDLLGFSEYVLATKR